MIKENIEQWRAIKGFEGLYEASSLGNVKSVERTCNCNGGVRRVREKILKPTLRGNEGYEHLKVSLSKNGVEKTYGVHQLVALAFPEICGLPFEGADANHIDENPFNNRADNINWLSHGDNIRFGTRTERAAKALTNHPDLSKTVYQYTLSGDLVKEWESLSEIHRQTGWNCGAISACCNNRFNREGNNVYKGFIWSYTRL